MIKTEFHCTDFHPGDHVVLVNDELNAGDCDRRLVPGVEGKVLDTFIGTDRVQVCWDVPNPSNLACWWVNAFDIRPVATFVECSVIDLL